MHISWLGTTAVRFQTKNDEKDINIVIDPYKPKVGNFPRSLTPDIVIFTNGEENSITLSGNPFVITSAGEYDVKGVLISVTEGHDKEHLMVRIDGEQLSIGHLGLVNKAINSQQSSLLSGVDILLVPFGHKEAYNSEMAVKMVNEIEPRIIIPIACQSENDPEAEPAEKFAKAMGMSPDKIEKKIIIKKKDLPQEEIKLVILDKE